MAQPINCDTCTIEQATCMITLIAEADVKAFCPGCFADFSQAFLAAVRPEVLAPVKATVKTRGKRTRPASPASSGEEGNRADDESTDTARAAERFGQGNGDTVDASEPA